MADKKGVDKGLFILGEYLLPQLLAVDLVRMEVQGREFGLQEGRMIGHFCLSQTVDSQIFLAVDECILRREVGDELLIDDCKSSVVICVGLFTVYKKRVVVDRVSLVKSDQLLAYIDTATDESQLLEMVECTLHGPLLCGQLPGVSLPGFAPFGFELHTL